MATSTTEPLRNLSAQPQGALVRFASWGPRDAVTETCTSIQSPTGISRDGLGTERVVRRPGEGDGLGTERVMQLGDGACILPSMKKPFPSVSDRPDWKILETKEIIKAPFLRVRHDRVELPDGRVMPSYYVIEFSPWVNIIALTPDRKLLMVEQYRHGIGQYTLEIPGGATDPGHDVDPIAAGLRELREETGYAPKKAAQVIATHSPNPALQSNACYTVLAEDCVRVGDPEPDPFEDIKIHEMPLTDVAAMVRDGRIYHSIVLGSLLAANPLLRIF
jgi:ADP-ribose pyrophosphatase